MKRHHGIKLGIIWSIVIICSCSGIKELDINTIYGKYRWISSYGDGGNSIYLKPDNTFIYNWRIGLCFGTTLGHWRVEKNNLILNSEFQPGMVYVEFCPNEESGTEYNIKLLALDTGEPLYFGCCKLMENSIVIEETYANEDGVCKLAVKQSADMLRFEYVGFESADLPLNGLRTNTITVKLKENGYEYFTEEKWKISSTRVYDPRVKRSRYNRKGYLEKME